MIKGIIFDFNRTLYDPETLGLIPGALPLLENLHSTGYRMALMSMAGKGERADQISQLGLNKYFIDIQIIEVDKDKTNFERAINSLAVLPSEIAVVGDRIRKEIVLGNGFGMRTIWYKAGKFSEEVPRNDSEKPTHIITILDDVLGCLL